MATRIKFKGCHVSIAVLADTILSFPLQKENVKTEILEANNFQFKILKKIAS